MPTCGITHHEACACREEQFRALEIDYQELAFELEKARDQLAVVLETLEAERFAWTKKAEEYASRLDVCARVSGVLDEYGSLESWGEYATKLRIATAKEKL